MVVRVFQEFEPFEEVVERSDQGRDSCSVGLVSWSLCGLLGNLHLTQVCQTLKMIQGLPFEKQHSLLVESLQQHAACCRTLPTGSCPRPAIPSVVSFSATTPDEEGGSMSCAFLPSRIDHSISRADFLGESQPWKQLPDLQWCSSSSPYQGEFTLFYIFRNHNELAVYTRPSKCTSARCLPPRPC